MPYLAQGKKSSIVFMFPGQGCQFYQMGRELYQNNPVFQRWMNELDARVRSELGHSVIAEIYHESNARSKPFDDIRVSHPAIFMIEYALGKTLVEQGIEPDYLLGASLGELVAATLADALPLDEAIRLVVGQGQLFHRRQSPATDGTLLAVLADEALFQRTPLLHEHCDIAAYNAPSLIVIAGQSARIADAERHLAAQDVVFQRLPVNQAFHSRHIDFLKPDVDAMAGRLSLRPLQVPLVSCCTTHALETFAPDHFWQAIRQPIRFSQTLSRLEHEAGARGEALIYLDLGPSGTLANLIRQNIRDRELPLILPVLSPFGRDLEKFDEVLALGRTLQPLPQSERAADPAPAHAIPQPRVTSPAQRPAPAPSTANGPIQVLVFPGQGSQRVGMGEELFDRFPEQVAAADRILGYSLKTLCLEDPGRQLANTQYTQPALYAVSALTFLERQRQGARAPDFLAGHSLGEYCALFAAGAFSFETGLALVKKRGELMAQASGGGMAAVIGRSPEEVASLLARHGFDALDVANYNSQAQVVLAGPVEVLDRARDCFQAQEITFVPLPVSAPFHSRYMRGVMETFGEYLRQYDYAPLQTPVISNVHARPYRDGELVDNLTRQICGSVRWLDSIRYLMEQGRFEYEEIGPGNVLTKLIASIRGA